MKFMEYLIFILAIILSVLGFYCYKYKLLKQIKIEKILVKGGLLIYTDYQGKYTQIGDLFQKTCGLIESELKDLNTQVFAIYFDDPSKIKDQSQSRAVVGIYLKNQMKKGKIIDFLGRHQEFRETQMFDIESFGCVLPFLNKVNVLFNVIRAYHTLKNFLVQNKLMDKVHFAMEIYNKDEQSMSVLFPVGETAKSLADLSGIQKPEYIKDKCKRD